MPMRAALAAAREQLAYWQAECESARREADSAREERCQRFIAQCEIMVDALISAQAAAERGSA
jgi:hypothetical protein